MFKSNALFSVGEYSGAKLTRGKLKQIRDSQKAPKTNDDVFDELHQTVKSSLTVKKPKRVYTRRQQQNKVKLGKPKDVSKQELVRFEESDTKNRVQKWLLNNETVFNRTLPSQELVESNDSMADSCEITSVSQKPKYLTLNEANPENLEIVKKTKRNSRSQWFENSKTKKRPNSLDLQYRTCNSARMKRHSIACESQEYENYQIEQFDTEPDLVNKEITKNIVKYMEEEFLASIDNCVMNSNEIEGESGEITIKNKKVNDAKTKNKKVYRRKSKTAETSDESRDCNKSGWERMNVINKSIKKDKKPKKLKVNIKVSKKKVDETPENVLHVNLDDFEKFEGNIFDSTKPKIEKEKVDKKTVESSENIEEGSKETYILNSCKVLLACVVSKNKSNKLAKKIVRKSPRKSPKKLKKVDNNNEKSTNKKVTNEIVSKRKVIDIDDIVAKKNVLNDIVAKKNMTGDIVAKKNVRNDAVAKKNIRNDAVAKKNIRNDVVAKKNIIDDTVAKKNITDDVVAKKNVKDGVVAKKNVTGDIVAKKNIRNDVVAKKNIRNDVVAKKNIIDDTVAKKNITEDIVANKNFKVDIVANNNLTDNKITDKDKDLIDDVNFTSNDSLLSDDLDLFSLKTQIILREKEIDVTLQNNDQNLPSTSQRETFDNPELEKVIDMFRTCIDLCKSKTLNSNDIFSNLRLKIPLLEHLLKVEKVNNSIAIQTEVLGIDRSLQTSKIVTNDIIVQTDEKICEEVGLQVEINKLTKVISTQTSKVENLVSEKCIQTVCSLESFNKGVQTSNLETSNKCFQTSNVGSFDKMVQTSNFENVREKSVQTMTEKIVCVDRGIKSTQTTELPCKNCFNFKQKISNKPESIVIDLTGELLEEKTKQNSDDSIFKSPNKVPRKFISSPRKSSSIKFVEDSQSSDIIPSSFLTGFPRLLSLKILENTTTKFASNESANIISPSQNYGDKKQQQQIIVDDFAAYESIPNSSLIEVFGLDEFVTESENIDLTRNIAVKKIPHKKNGNEENVNLVEKDVQFSDSFDLIDFDTEAILAGKPIYPKSQVKIVEKSTNNVDKNIDKAYQVIPEKSTEIEIVDKTCKKTDEKDDENSSPKIAVVSSESILQVAVENVVDIEDEEEIVEKIDEKTKTFKRIRSPGCDSGSDVENSPKRFKSRFEKDLSVNFETESMRPIKEVDFIEEMANFLCEDNFDTNTNNFDTNNQKTTSCNKKLDNLFVEPTNLHSAVNINPNYMDELDELVRNTTDNKNTNLKPQITNFNTSINTLLNTEVPLTLTLTENVKTVKPKLAETVDKNNPVVESLEINSKDPKRSVLSEIMCPPRKSPKINVIENLIIEKGCLEKCVYIDKSHKTNNEVTNNEDAESDDYILSDNEEVMIFESPKKKKTKLDLDVNNDAFLKQTSLINLPPFIDSPDIISSNDSNLSINQSFIPPPPEFATILTQSQNTPINSTTIIPEINSQIPPDINSDFLNPSKNPSTSNNFSTKTHNSTIPDLNKAIMETSTQNTTQSQDDLLITLSPIEDLARNPLMFATTSKYSPLTISIKKDREKVVKSTTPQQKTKQNSILSYIKRTQHNKSSLNESTIDLVAEAFESEEIDDFEEEKNCLPENCLQENCLPENFIPCVACSRINKDEIIAISSLTKKKLITFSTVFNETVTHMIVSVNDNNQIPDHTMKFVSAVAAGIWVLNSAWIRTCLKNNAIISEEPYEVLDVSGIPGPRESRLFKKTRPLLNNFLIYAAPPFKATTQDVVENVITTLGGTIAKSIQDISQENENEKICLAITEASASQNFTIYEDWVENSKVATVDIEWLSRSVGQYKTLSLIPFLLCNDEDVYKLNYPKELLENLPPSYT